MKSIVEKKADSKRFVRHSMEIALLVSKMIEENKLSKSKFAEQVGVNATEVSKWLSGTQNFTLRTLSKIENALDVLIVRDFSREELGLEKKRFSLPAKDNGPGIIIEHDFVGTKTKKNPKVGNLELDDVIGY